MNRVFYNIKQAIQQIFRNFGMSLASMFAITAMMLILGLFFVISVNLNLFTESVRQDYDTVEVFLKDSVTATEAKEIMEDFGDLSGVSSVKYRSKSQAMKIMRKRWGDSAYLLDSLGSNPLPNSLLVKVEGVEAAQNVNEVADAMDNVESTKYYKDTIDKLTRVTKYIQVGSLLVMLFLIIVSVVVVSNTIKLTVFARSKEIAIMRYIGATNWFIRGPFLVEGMLIGILASLVSAGVTYLLYSRLVAVMGVKIMTLLSSPLVPATYLANNLVIIFLAMGLSIGAVGSIISMRKFLKA